MIAATPSHMRTADEDRSIRPFYFAMICHAGVNDLPHSGAWFKVISERFMLGFDCIVDDALPYRGLCRNG